MIEAMRQNYVGIDMEQPSVVSQIGQAKIDRASLVEFVAVLMEHLCLDTVDAILIAETMSLSVSSIRDDDDAIAEIQGARERVSEKV
jgi:hypothetical protein